MGPRNNGSRVKANKVGALKEACIQRSSLAKGQIHTSAEGEAQGRGG